MQGVCDVWITSVPYEESNQIQGGGGGAGDILLVVMKILFLLGSLLRRRGEKDGCTTRVMEGCISPPVLIIDVRPSFAQYLGDFERRRCRGMVMFRMCWIMVAR